MMIFPALLMLLVPMAVLGSNMLSEKNQEAAVDPLAEPLVDFSSNLHTMTVSGTFPENPAYALTTFYDPTCTTTYGAAAILLQTCLTSGTTSIIYNCGRFLQFSLFCVITYVSSFLL